MTRSAPDLDRYTVNERGCWLWTGGRTADGYARISGRRPLVHKLSYERFRGPIPAGRQLIHTCGAKACVNPAHLRLTDGPKPDLSQNDLLRWVEFELNSGCWLWAKSVGPQGYGTLQVYQRKGVFTYKRAHRAFYEAFVGPIPDDLQVCHRCDTPACCNPAHLFLGTAQVNALDREVKGRGVSLGVRQKLTPEQIAFIRAHYRPGDPAFGARALARRFGISNRTVAYHGAKA